MPDNPTNTTGGVAAAGGSQPSETGPGATGGSPMSGGQAVPDAETLMGGDSGLGDSGSLDDGALGNGLNSGDSVKEEGKAVSTPKMSPEGPGGSPQDADAPTGGLGGVSSVGGD